MYKIYGMNPHQNEHESTKPHLHRLSTCMAKAEIMVQQDNTNGTPSCCLAVINVQLSDLRGHPRRGGKNTHKVHQSGKSPNNHFNK